MAVTVNFNLCPECLADNTDDAGFCRRCGHALGADTVPQPLGDRNTQFLPGGLWLDELERPATQGGNDPITITLRELTPPAAAPSPPSPLPPTTIEALWTDAPEMPPHVDDTPSTIPDRLPAAGTTLDMARAWPPLPVPLAVELPELREVLPPPAPAAAPAAAPVPAADELARIDAKRAARRASVRRSRLRALAQRADPAAPHEVLVIDRNDIERGILCGLLQAFGFTTHGVGDPAQALPLLQGTAFIAVFADIAFDASDGGAGIDLARALRALQPRPLFVLVTGALSPVDRVRAELTGCDDIVAKRVTRGSVARVLDVHGIPLPADARRT